MATINDKLCKVSDGTGAYPNAANVTVARAAGNTVLTCDSLAGWAKDTPVHFSTYRLNADGTVDTSTQVDWKGIVLENNITQMTRKAGATDTGNLVGDKVELNPTVGWADDLVEGIKEKFPIKVGDIEGWDSLNSKAFSSKVSVGSAQVVLASYTIPASGIYSLSAYATTGITGATKHILAAFLYNNSTALLSLAQSSIENYAGNNNVSVRGDLIWKFNQGDVIKLLASVQNATVNVDYKLYVQQIW